MENPSFRMIAQTLHGLEDVLRTELVKLGARETERHNRAVSFTGDQGFLYKANLCLRTAIRVLVPIGSFDARNTEDLYLGIKRIRQMQARGEYEGLTGIYLMFILGLAEVVFGVAIIAAMVRT